MRKATFEFGTGKPEKALARYEALGAIHCKAIDESVARRLMIEAWSADRLEGKSQLMMAYTNVSVYALNQAARQVKIGAGEIKQGLSYSTAKGKRHFAKGDRIYFLENNRTLDVKNGSLGTIQSINTNQFIVMLDGKDNRLVTFDIIQYKHIDHGYAATIHKAQGVTVDKAYALLSRYFDRHLTYVACTRHRESITLFGHKGDFKNKEMFYHILSRERSKSMVVDFAQARWIEPQNKQELYDKLALSQTQLAQERLELKSLKTLLPEKEFSFAHAMGSVKGWINGVITLSDNRQMLCVGNKQQSKLVAMRHEFENHLGKQVSIQLDKHGKIVQCLVKDQGKTLTLIDRAKELKTLSVDQSNIQNLSPTKSQVNEATNQKTQEQDFSSEISR